MQQLISIFWFTSQHRINLSTKINSDFVTMHTSPKNQVIQASPNPKYTQKTASGKVLSYSQIGFELVTEVIKSPCYHTLPSNIFSWCKNVFSTRCHLRFCRLDELICTRAFILHLVISQLALAHWLEASPCCRAFFVIVLVVVRWSMPGFWKTFQYVEWGICDRMFRVSNNLRSKSEAGWWCTPPVYVTSGSITAFFIHVCTRVEHIFLRLESTYFHFCLTIFKHFNYIW